MASGPAWIKKSSITSGTSRRSLASADLPMIAARFSSRLANPSRAEWVIWRKRPLPLEGQVGRGHNQDALDQPPHLQFLQQQANHNRFACAGVIRQQKRMRGSFKK